MKKVAKSPLTCVRTFNQSFGDRGYLAFGGNDFIGLREYGITKNKKCEISSFGFHQQTENSSRIEKIEFSNSLNAKEFSLGALDNQRKVAVYVPKKRSESGQMNFETLLFDASKYTSLPLNDLVFFNPSYNDEEYMITVGDDSMVFIVNLTKRKKKLQLENKIIKSNLSCLTSVDNEKLESTIDDEVVLSDKFIVSSREGKCEMFDFKSRQSIKTFTTEIPDKTNSSKFGNGQIVDNLMAVQYNNIDKNLIGGVAGKFWFVWDVRKLSTPVICNPGHFKGGVDFRWSPIERNTFCTCSLNEVKIWDLYKKGEKDDNSEFLSSRFSQKYKVGGIDLMYGRVTTKIPKKDEEEEGEEETENGSFQNIQFLVTGNYGIPSVFSLE